MQEGSLGAPIRHPLAWQQDAFYDLDAVDAEMRRVFDICHTCRRCFNLCDSFPRLFDLIDSSSSGEVDGVATADFPKVTEACTLCDMCFMTKCPYVPPHEFNLDFPHLMLRHRAALAKKDGRSFVQAQLAELDRNASVARIAPGLANWAGKPNNPVTRPALETLTGIDRTAPLPHFAARTFTAEAKAKPVVVNREAPAFGRKAVLYATCSVNNLKTKTGLAARAVLARNGVETEIVYPACCGMPHLEGGDIARVAEQAKKVSSALRPWIDQNHAVIALTASCALMFKFEWPLILPDDPDVLALSRATFDIAQYVVDIARTEGLVPGLKPVEGGVTVHLACHARAQNAGPKAAEMLRLIPETQIQVIERCSGHGGTFGIMKETRPVALKVGKPVGQAAIRQGSAHVVSECPLAADHIVTLMGDQARKAEHPIEILAEAYGLEI